jgi:hypothetical protein
MSTKARPSRKTRSRGRTRRRKAKRNNNLIWLLGIAGLLLILIGLAIVRSSQQQAVVEARPLETDRLLPLADPVEPIFGWHDMNNLPDPNQAGQVVPADQPQPNVDMPLAEYDFGSIPSGPGNVSQLFHIENRGAEVLEVSNVTTSCGCTTAELSSSVIPPGKRADLTVVFDPDYHDAVGPVKRIVWLETNDPDQPVVEVSFDANVRQR